MRGHWRQATRDGVDRDAWTSEDEHAEARRHEEAQGMSIMAQVEQQERFVSWLRSAGITGERLANAEARLASMRKRNEREQR